jgi:hypothetical protein
LQHQEVDDVSQDGVEARVEEEVEAVVELAVVEDHNVFLMRMEMLFF